MKKRRSSTKHEPIVFRPTGKGLLFAPSDEAAAWDRFFVGALGMERVTKYTQFGLPPGEFFMRNQVLDHDTTEALCRAEAVADAMLLARRRRYRKRPA